MRPDLGRGYGIDGHMLPKSVFSETDYRRGVIRRIGTGGVRSTCLRGR